MRDRILCAIRARVVEPIVRLLQQGVTHHSIAVSMSAGTVIGVFPVLGSTTLICLLVAIALRLNLVLGVLREEMLGREEMLEGAQ